MGGAVNRSANTRSFPIVPNILPHRGSGASQSGGESVFRNKYIYMPELRQLDRNTPDEGQQVSLPPEATVVNMVSSPSPPSGQGVCVIPHTRDPAYIPNWFCLEGEAL